MKSTLRTLFVTCTILTTAFSAQAMDLSAAPAQTDQTAPLTYKLDRDILNPRDLATKMEEFFLNAYADLSLDALKINTELYPTKDAWLKATFDEELEDFTKQVKPVHWVAAYQGDALVGIGIFEPDPTTPNRIHVRQMALSPDFRHQHFGTSIGQKIFDIVKTEYPTTESFVANVRKLNLTGIAFVRSLHFERQDVTYHGYNPENYFGFLLAKKVND